MGAAGTARLRARIARISWRDLALSLGPILLISVVAIWVAFRFVRPAPPHTITITTGADGSAFRRSAERYRSILARNGVTLEILPSRGALENLQRLSDPAFRVDVGFVQGGLTTGVDISNVVSLGSVFYEPLFVFYRSPRPVDMLSQLAGGRIATGGVGSGTRALALTLLAALWFGSLGHGGWLLIFLLLGALVAGADRWARHRLLGTSSRQDLGWFAVGLLKYLIAGLICAWRLS